jgi:hypothetical protein
LESLEQWIHSWWDDGQGELVKLSPEGWFKEGQRDSMVFGFMCRLQGKEIVHVDIAAGFLKYLEVSREHPECPQLVVP